MSIPPDLERTLVERRANEEREARRDTRREHLMTLALLFFWVLVGMGFIGVAVHVNDEAWGQIWWWTGWLLWVGGVLFTLHRAYWRGVERGDWR